MNESLFMKVGKRSEEGILELRVEKERRYRNRTKKRQGMIQVMRVFFHCIERRVLCWDGDIIIAWLRSRVGWLKKMKRVDNSV